MEISDNKTSKLPSIGNPLEFDFSFCKICNKLIEGRHTKMSFSRHLKYTHYIDIKTYYIMFWEIPKCKCGCTEDVPWTKHIWWGRLLSGHPIKIIKEVKCRKISYGTPTIIRNGKRRTAIEIECCICKNKFLREASYVRKINQKTGKMACSKTCLKILQKEQNSIRNPNSTPEGVPFVINKRGNRCRAVKINCCVCNKEFLKEQWAVSNSKKRSQVITCSRECLKSYHRQISGGSKNPNWRGGIPKGRDKDRSSWFYVNWKRKVHLRDGNVCQMCFQIGKKLHCHHILKFKKYIDYRFEVWNGITLCNHCHQSIIYRENEYIERFLKITCGETVH